MPQDSRSLDHLPDEGPAADGHDRQTRIVVVLLAMVLVIGLVVVLVLLAMQRPNDPATPESIGAPTSTADPTDPPTDEGTADGLDAALADLDASRSTLATAITSGEDLLAATDGQVAEDVTRDGLADALTTARGVLAEDVDTARVSDVQSAATRARATTANVQHAAGLVADSHEEWLGEQAVTPDPVDPASPVNPVPLPTDRATLPGPTSPPDRTPRPGPDPIPIPDNQN